MVDVKLITNISASVLNKMGEEIAKTAAEKVAQEALSMSQDRCPVDTGALKGSSYIKPISKGYEVGYKENYALYVESLPQSSLSKTGHGGKAHFLSGTLQKALNKGLKSVKGGVSNG